MRDYEIIALKGRANGTARLYAYGGGTAAEFALRGMAAPAAAVSSYRFAFSTLIVSACRPPEDVVALPVEVNIAPAVLV